MQKTRPCIVLSPDEMNQYLRPVIIAPMTATTRTYPMRVPIRLQRKNGHIALDQLRAVDRSRLVRKLGAAERATAARVGATLAEMFAPTGA